MMKYQAPFPPKYHILRLLSAQLPELHVSANTVRWQHFRLLGTEAARDIPNVDRSKRRIPKEERKKLVVTYVNKYRTTNAGKFPSASITMKEVGGSYYTIKSILQELERNSKLSTVEAPSKNTMVRQTAGVYGIIAEDGSSSQARVENDRLKTKNNNTSAEDLSGSESMIELELLRECGTVSSSDSGKYVKNGQVAETETLILVEQTSLDETIEATTKRNSEDLPRPNHASEVQGTSITKELGEVDMASSYASESEDVSGSQNLEFQRKSVKASVAGKIVKKGQLSETETPIYAEQTSVDETFKATTTSNPENPGIAMASSKASESEDAPGSRRMIEVKSGQASESEITNLVKQSSVDETIKATTTKDPENLEILRHASDICGSFKTKELGKTDIHSSQASESGHTTGDNTVQEPPNSSLWGNLKSLASNVINSWKKA